MRFNFDKAVLFEAVAGSFVLAVGGIGTVMIAGYLNGVQMSVWQAIGMNVFFFHTRLLGLIPTRYVFKRWGKK